MSKDEADLQAELDATNKQVEILSDALAESRREVAALTAVQEPVAWTLLLVGEHHGIIGKAGETFLGHPEHYERIDVYTTPPAAQRPWVGLTDERVRQLCGSVPSMKAAVREAEAELKEKNT